MKEVDYLIVGQGLAGTLLATELLNANKTVQLFDADHRGAASTVAAGIVNPITGRRLVKTWMIDELLPVALMTYKKQEELLKCRFLYPVDIHRALNDLADENNWITRSGYEDNRGYLSPKILPKSPEGMKPVLGRGVIQKACRVDLPAYVGAWKTYFLEKEMLETGHFKHDDIKLENNQVTYQNWTAKKIIFCEGHQIINNPWFKYIPMVLAKGEVLILKVPDLKTAAIYKNNLTYVPLGEDLFWVGATYHWTYTDGQPSENIREELIERVGIDLTVPFTIVKHQAAIRPTIKDRRPVLGAHPDFGNVLLFNGLGTKGASLGPYWSAAMARHIIKGDAIDASVRIDRFNLPAAT